MARSFNVPKDPETLGGIIAILRILAGERTPESSLEKSIVAALRDKDRAHNARRMVGALESTPPDVRERMLGEITNSSYRIPEPILSSATSATDITWSLQTGVLNNILADRNSIDRLESEHALNVPVFTIRYQGLFCQSEMDWDRGSNSDEIYVITSAVHITADGTNVVRTERHPVQQGQGHYSDVDHNEERAGPVAAVWHGTANPASLSVIVMEHDDGDPDKYKEDINAFVEVALEYLKAQYPIGDRLDKLKDTVVDAINYIFGSGDDTIETIYKILDKEEMENLTLHKPGFYYNIRSNKPTSILQHFTTSHSGGGATYIICFDIVRDPSHEIPHVIL